ncbi:MAG: helix-turn-helix transcriptional regulator [Pseudobdellovibrio sp.]
MRKKAPLNVKNNLFLKKFGKRVREARLAKGWTLEEMEERGWASWQHLQQIETGLKNINLTTLIKLTNLLDVDANKLLHDL